MNMRRNGLVELKVDRWKSFDLTLKKRKVIMIEWDFGFLIFFVGKFQLQLNSLFFNLTSNTHNIKNCLIST